MLADVLKENIWAQHFEDGHFELVLGKMDREDEQQMEREQPVNDFERKGSAVLFHAWLLGPVRLQWVPGRKDREIEVQAPKIVLPAVDSIH